MQKLDAWLQETRPQPRLIQTITIDLRIFFFPRGAKIYPPCLKFLITSLIVTTTNFLSHRFPFEFIISDKEKRAISNSYPTSKHKVRKVDPEIATLINFNTCKVSKGVFVRYIYIYIYIRSDTKICSTWHYRDWFIEICHWVPLANPLDNLVIVDNQLTKLEV